MDLLVDNSKLKYQNSKLDSREIASLVYHDIFDYPLTFSELIKWRAGHKLAISHQPSAINYSNGFYFLEGKGAVVYKRLLKKRTSVKKLEIAKDAARVLSLIPTIRMVGVTGALAMENASEESDIDLMIITSRGNLWLTRLLVHLILFMLVIPVRRAGRRDERDKLCLNMWLEENGLVFRRRNIYTSHEIAQILPLVNKGETYEKFIWKNKWITEFWPNSVKIQTSKFKLQNSKSLITYCLVPIALVFERLAFWLQYQYMKRKITREIVTPTRALFHPIDWGEVVLKRLSS